MRRAFLRFTRTMVEGLISRSGPKPPALKILRNKPGVGVPPPNPLESYRFSFLKIHSGIARTMAIFSRQSPGT